VTGVDVVSELADDGHAIVEVPDDAGRGHGVLMEFLGTTRTGACTASTSWRSPTCARKSRSPNGRHAERRVRRLSWRGIAAVRASVRLRIGVLPSRAAGVDFA
jgi:hypothetical protein